MHVHVIHVHNYEHVHVIVHVDVYSTLHYTNNYSYYSSSELVSIYLELLSSHFLVDSSSSELDYDLLTILINSAVQIHTKISTAFIPTDERKHYLYTLSTLDSIMRLVHCGLDECT